MSDVEPDIADSSDQTPARWVKGVVIALVGILVLTGLTLFELQRRDQTPNPTIPSPQNEQLRLEVEQAYIAYWDSYSAALLNLDTSGLEAVLSGEALETTKKLVEEHRASRRPVRVEVRHGYEIRFSDGDTALVEDRLLDRSVPLDPETGHPNGPRANTQSLTRYTLEKEGGVWKVVRIEPQGDQTPAG